MSKQLSFGAWFIEDLTPYSNQVTMKNITIKKENVGKEELTLIRQAKGKAPKDSCLDTLNSKTYPYRPKHIHKYPHIPIVF